MSKINISNLTFCHKGGYTNLFQDVNMQLDTDWKLGLVGRNGTGKTTLFNILLGKLPYSGKITAAVEFEYFPYGVTDERKSVGDILAEINPNYEEWRVRRELNQLDMRGCEFWREFLSYSLGEQTKILLAATFSKDNAFLLIDEPTNHLDKRGRELVKRYLDKKSGYIIISHDRDFIDGCVDHILSINRADIILQSGNLSTYLDERGKQTRRELGENEKLNAEIKRLKVASERSGQWANKAEQSKFSGTENKSGLRPDRGHLGAKAAKVMKRSVIMKERAEQAIEDKSKLLKNVDRADKIYVTEEKFFRDTLITVKDLVVYYDGAAVNEPISFEIARGERLLLSGKNGAGKSSVIRAILGEKVDYTGSIEYNQNLKIAYVSQDIGGLRGKVKDYCAENGLDATALLTYLHRLGLEPKEFEKDIADFSDGQKKKLQIAACLCKKANIFIWDEPLNYIDIISREQIKEMLLQSGATMLFVEHDGAFCKEIATAEAEVVGI